MYDRVMDDVYNEGKNSYLGDTNPHPESSAEERQEWLAGHNDMVIDAMADDDWPI